MINTLLNIDNLSVVAEEKEILRNLNLHIQEGETHIIMGPNGAGKSTLGNVIMGNPQYEVTSGKIFFDGVDITEERTDERASKGLFLSFQAPIEIPGVTISQFIRTATNAISSKKIRSKQFRQQMDEALATLNMNPNWINRELNVGFSGGERKKIEMLQLLMLQPRLAILDETDSGLDVDAVKTVSKGIKEFQKQTNHSLLIITHNTKILEFLNVDYVHILVNGTIVKTGGVELIKQINEQGYEAFQG